MRGPQGDRRGGPGGERPLWQALAELALFLAVFALVALRSERPLLAELRGGLRPVVGSDA